jgi:hypothetical protein
MVGTSPPDGDVEESYELHYALNSTTTGSPHTGLVATPDQPSHDKATMRLVCACGEGGSQTRGKGGVASVYEPNPELSGLFLSPSRPFRPTLLSLSQVTAHSKAHMQQQVLRCVLRGVDCMRGLLDTLTTQHPSGAQQAPTYHPLALRPPARTGTIPERKVWGFESATYTKDMLARRCLG